MVKIYSCVCIRKNVCWDNSIEEILVVRIWFIYCLMWEDMVL